MTTFRSYLEFYEDVFDVVILVEKHGFSPFQLSSQDQTCLWVRNTDIFSSDNVGPNPLHVHVVSSDLSRCFPRCVCFTFCPAASFPPLRESGLFGFMASSAPKAGRKAETQRAVGHSRIAPRPVWRTTHKAFDALRHLRQTHQNHKSVSKVCWIEGLIEWCRTISGAILHGM